MVIHFATVSMCQDDRKKWVFSLYFVDDCMAPSSFAVLIRKNELGQCPVILTEQAWSIIKYYHLIIKFKVHRPRRSRGQ